MEDENFAEQSQEIRTESNQIIHYNKAGFIRRFIAAGIDHVLLFLVLLFLINVFFDYLFIRFLLKDWLFALFIIVSVLIVNFYFIIFELLWQGKTPGKWFTNIRVVTSKNVNPGLSHILIRNLLRSIYFIPPLFIIPDVICYLFLERRRIGDLLAGTDVISLK